MFESTGKHSQYYGPDNTPIQYALIYNATVLICQAELITLLTSRKETLFIAASISAL